MKNVKRFVAWALALVMLISVGALGAVAADFTVSVATRSTTASIGSVFSFSVVVDSINSDDGLLSVDIPLRYDEDVFDCISITPVYPDVWGTPENFSYSQQINGVLWLRMLNDEDSFSSEYGCTEGGAMCFEVKLRVKESAALGSTEISVDGDGAFLVLSATLADGMCTPAYGTGTDVSVEITERVSTLGDVNGDGVADNLDAAYVLRYDALLITLDDNQIASADVNGDGNADNLDAAILLKYDAGIISHFPVEQ